MDLRLKGGEDEAIRYSQWGRKNEVHTLAKKSYQMDASVEDGDWWKLSGALVGVPGMPKCNLPIIIARLSASVPLGGRRFNQIKTIEEEGFLVKKNLAKWTMKRMFYTKAAAENFEHLFVPAPKAVYAVPNYEEHLPKQALDVEQFITEFEYRTPRNGCWSADSSIAVRLF